MRRLGAGQQLCQSHRGAIRQAEKVNLSHGESGDKSIVSRTSNRRHKKYSDGRNIASAPWAQGNTVQPKRALIAAEFRNSGISQRYAAMAANSTFAESPLSSRRWEHVMKFPHCPYMDRLGRALIDAYRRQGDLDTELYPSIEILKLHSLMTEHRIDCPLCIRIESARRTAALNALRALETQQQ